MDEIDIAKVRNYVETKVLAPMNIQEQKALCRIVLDIVQWRNDLEAGVEILLKDDAD